MSPLIRCSHSKMMPIEQLVENPRNPNTHPEEQLVLLAKIINSQGWRQPIVVSERSGFIVKGHGRYQAAKLAGFTECPVDIQSYDSEASEWADLIADNRLAELSVINKAGLKDLIQELDTGAIDIELTGYDNQSIEALMTEIFQDKNVDLDEFFEKEEPKDEGEMGRIVLEYNLQDYKLICDKLTNMSGSREDIFFRLLFP